MRAYKLHSKASKVGFDWPDTAGVWEKVLEELHELEEAVAGEPEGNGQSWEICCLFCPVMPDISDWNRKQL
ncbi:MAG: hypothetical protein ACLRXQ_08860 [Phascolarctobacterium faecium]